MENEGDILVELSNGDLEELAKMYELHQNQLPHLHSFLQICIKSKKNGMSDFVTVWSPNSCWRYDGTFIASMPAHGHDIVLHSLDPSGKNLIDGLVKTKKFSFVHDPAREYTFFYAVHELFYSKIVTILTEVLKYEILWSDILNIWCLEKEKAIKHNNTHSSDCYVKEIEPADVSIINSFWPFHYADSERKLLDWLKLTKGYGVYLKSNSQLVSWVTSSCLGQMTALQTLEEHKLKGYGSLAVKNMAKQLAENGFNCCATVYFTNTGSEALLEKLEFRKMFKCQFIAVHNKY